MTQAEIEIRDLLNATADNPCTATIGDSTYVGMNSSLEYPDKAEAGGFLKDYDATFLIALKKLQDDGQLTDQFTTEPANGDAVTIDSVDYEVKKIVRTVRDGIGIALQLDLENADK